MPIYPNALARLSQSLRSPAVTPKGFTPTSFAIAPTVQFHAHTSNKTMRPNGTIQGYISGTTLTVTTHSQGTVRALATNMQLISGAATGTKIVQPLYTGNPGNGGTGQYAVNISQTVGSSSAPATFTILSDQINLLGDLKGVADLTADSTGDGPVLMTDGYGVSFLRFTGGYSGVQRWMRNLTYNGNGGTDSHNISWIMAAASMTSKIARQPISVSAQEKTLPPLTRAITPSALATGMVSQTSPDRSTTPSVTLPSRV